MILEIKQIGNPVLRKQAKEINKIDDDIKKLSQDMLETMNNASGVGIAGPQVGKSLQIAIADIKDFNGDDSKLSIDDKEVDIREYMPLIFLNPQFEKKGEKITMEEGCLSISEIREKVSRPDFIEGYITFLNGKRVKFNAQGMLSRIIQHESDHLKGILFIDRVAPIIKSKIRKKVRMLIKGN